MFEAWLHLRTAGGFFVQRALYLPLVRVEAYASHLVDEVMPIAPYRQWTLSLPYDVRFRVGCDKNLLSAAMGLNGVPLNPGCDVTIKASGPVAMTTPTLAGMPLNPGCDATIKNDGPSSMTSFTLANKLTWLITAGTKYWAYTETPGAYAFTDSGGDFASLLRTLPPMN